MEINQHQNYVSGGVALEWIFLGRFKRSKNIGIDQFLGLIFWSHIKPHDKAKFLS